MREENYWQQFTHSGRIEDYLSYIKTNRQMADVNSRQQKAEGDYPYAGFYCGNGNGINSDAYR